MYLYNGWQYELIKMMPVQAKLYSGGRKVFHKKASKKIIASFRYVMLKSVLVTYFLYCFFAAQALMGSKSVSIRSYVSRSSDCISL